MAIVRYTFTGKLELTGALHIGSGGGGRVGAGEAPTDATVIRDSRGRPYIPGSSLRGVLRSAVSQLAPAFFDDRIAQLHEEELYFAGVKREVEELVLAARDRQAGDPARFDMEAERELQLDSRLSALERLFGTVLWASPLLIPDLHLVEGGSLAGEIRHGVGIDRDTGAAKDAIKYDFEVLPAGARFGLWMRCDIPTQPPEYLRVWPQLLALGLRLLEQGDLPLGGRAARGVGQVRLRELKVFRLDRSNRAALLGALLSDSPDAHSGVEQQHDWTRAILQEVR